MTSAPQIRADLKSIIGYSCETAAPNAHPATEFITDRWMQPRLDALVTYVLGHPEAVRLAATEWCHGEATSDQAMSAVLGAVGCQTCEAAP